MSTAKQCYVRGETLFMLFLLVVGCVLSCRILLHLVFRIQISRYFYVVAKSYTSENLLVFSCSNCQEYTDYNDNDNNPTKLWDSVYSDTGIFVK